jgi:ribosomal protein S18 acetylase RimI-like enzyme
MELGLAHAFNSTSLRVGDLSWLGREHTHRELSLDIRIWDDDAGELIAWTYFRANGEFNVFVTPGAGSAALFDKLLTVIDQALRASIAAGDPPVSLNTYGVDPARSAEDRALAAALDRSGFQIEPSTSGVMRCTLDQVPTPALAKGEVVAFCTAWLDEENAAGLLEPVGTHPAHQRRGLARAVCTDALRALRAAGARTAQVGFGSAAGYATYRSVGFERFGADLVFRRGNAQVC